MLPLAGRGQCTLSAIACRTCACSTSRRCRSVALGHERDSMPTCGIGSTYLRSASKSARLLLPRVKSGARRRLRSVPFACGCRISRRRWRYPQLGRLPRRQPPRPHAKSIWAAAGSLDIPTTDGRPRGLMRHPRVIPTLDRRRPLTASGACAPATRVDARAGETRARTGGTTIFSRYVESVRGHAIPGNKRFRRKARSTAMSAICRFIPVIQGMATIPFEPAVAQAANSRVGPS